MVATRVPGNVETPHEPDNASIENEQLRHFRFMAPTRGLRTVETPQELLGGASVPASRVGSLAPSRGYASPTSRFMAPMRDCRIVDAPHEPSLQVES